LPGYVPEHVIQQIARSADFVNLARSYCDLTQKGRKFWGLCPFHQEKTASFSIDPERGLFYCFGCKEGGSIFTFLQKVEGLTFRESLERLARSAGVDLSEYRGQGGVSSDQAQHLRRANELAVAFYEKCLRKETLGGKARRYLAGRGITPESIEHWRLGYSPDGWEHFLSFAHKRNVSDEVLEKAGLVVARGEAGGCYDRFRNRLMFPIEDRAGRAVGFGARALDDRDEPKYLNTPATPLFDKSSNFYGLSKAREAIRTGRTAVVMEGYTDVIMAHQCGIQEAVAVLGTALTGHHARALGRLAERVVLVFDADEAGERSAMRSIEALLAYDVNVRVVRLPSGADPCDYLIERGGEDLRGRIEASEDFFRFRLEHAREVHNTDTVEGRHRAFREVASLVAHIADGAKREMVMRELAREFGLSEESVWRTATTTPARTATTAGTPGPAQERLRAEEMVPSELLGLLLVHPEFGVKAADRIDCGELFECPARDALQLLLERFHAGDAADCMSFVNSLGRPELAEAAGRAAGVEEERAETISEVSAGERLEGYLNYIAERRHYRERQEAIAVALKAPAEQLDEEALRALESKIREKDRRIRRT